MHLPTLLLTSLLALPLTSACLIFKGTISTQIPRKITGTLVDNGVEVCSINNFIDNASVASAWAAFKCVKGVTAWIQTDGSRIGYFNGQSNYEFVVNEGKMLGTGGIGKQTKELWAENYGC